MPERHLFEIRISVPVGLEPARRIEQEISRILCPDPEHVPPCPIPWSTAVFPGDTESGGTVTEIRIGLYAAERDAEHLRRRVEELAFHRIRPARMNETQLLRDVDDYSELVVQYRIEHGAQDA